MKDCLKGPNELYYEDIFIILQIGISQTKGVLGGQKMAEWSYEGISVREAMERINNPIDGWFLPATQRQYVWGNRSNSEEYICLLLDSLLKRYPIGGLVLWKTCTEVAYHEFLKDFKLGARNFNFPKEHWDASKSLVYDGQQRLQTLYSVLRFTFNGRTLYYDLLFDAEEHETDETGFFFVNCGETAPQKAIALISLSSLKPDDVNKKRELRNRFFSDLDDKQQALVEANLDRLWKIFVERDTKSIAYFSVNAETPQTVNEVFRRLNTGGMPLTQLELVLSKLKAVEPCFEEDLWTLSDKIKDTTCIEFTALELVQLLYLLVYGTTRVDESKVKEGEETDLIKMCEVVSQILPTVFNLFFWERFRINTKRLIPRQQAILPILVYFVERFRNGFRCGSAEMGNSSIATYFIKSQLCDWNTQTMVTLFSRAAIAAGRAGNPFPLAEITLIAGQKNRTRDVYFYQLEGNLWYSLKILTPNRQYTFKADRTPQVDHIFPKALKSGQPDAEEFAQSVDVLWNMQPVPAEVNNFKRAKHPADYFKSEEGRASWGQYNYMPESPDAPEIQNADEFIAFRKEKMLEALRNLYGIDVKDNPQG